MGKYRYFLLLASAFVGSVGASPSSPSAKEDAAIGLLLSALRTSHFFSGRVALDCVGFSVPSSDGENYEIDVRETHARGCPGDFGVEPVIETFRVNLSTHRILLLDISTGDYINFSSARK